MTTQFDIPHYFKKAIVRRPCENMVQGLTEADMGSPDFDLACQQHEDYVEALKECNLEVTELDALNDYPDSCFVEDAALLTPKCAILMHPGAASRQGEVAHIEAAVCDSYDHVERITAPGTVEAGDIMMVGSHYYIGLSDRTNSIGAAQLINILERYGLSGEVVEMSEMLHLKTGLSYLENGHLLVCGEFVSKQQFSGFKRAQVSMQDSYTANSVWINDTVLVPAGFASTSSAIESMGYKVREVAMTEFQKLDGGLSCLSLRF